MKTTKPLQIQVKFKGKIKEKIKINANKKLLNENNQKKMRKKTNNEF